MRDRTTPVIFYNKVAEFKIGDFMPLKLKEWWTELHPSMTETRLLSCAIVSLGLIFFDWNISSQYAHIYLPSPAISKGKQQLTIQRNSSKSTEEAHLFNENKGSNLRWESCM